MSEKELAAMPNEDVDVKSRVLTIRGVQVMLDRDLAELYGVETRALNQAVKRNAGRFPADFMFQLTKEECLRSQIVTLKESRGKHLKYLPFAFTESGVAMLSGVLRSSIAIDVNIRIMRAFVAMRHFLQANGAILQRLETVEMKQLTMGDQLNKILDAMQDKILPSHQIFYQGQFWDAKSLLVKFIRRAKKSLVVVDAYLGVATLDMLAKRQRGVSIELITHSNGDLAETDLEAFGRQYGNLTKSICGVCHDRFIITDGTEVYWIGASLKDAGRLTFAVAKIGADIIPGLLDSLHKATSDRKEYGCKLHKLGAGK